MKTSILTSIIFSTAILAGCGTFNKSKVTTPEKNVERPVEKQPENVNSFQKLSTTFKRQGVKIEWDVSNSGSKGELKSIEVTGYASTNGTSENNIEDGFKVAELEAKARLRRFLSESIINENTVKTLSRNVEKAKNVSKTNPTSTGTISMTDEEASISNISDKENSNEIARVITRVIKSQSMGILRGVYVSDEEVVDRQTVKVTIRWDQKSDSAQQILRLKFGE